MITHPEGITSDIDTSLIRLRAILESQQKRRLNDAEVQEIASSLLSLFELLAEGEANDR